MRIFDKLSLIVPMAAVSALVGLQSTAFAQSGSCPYWGFGSGMMGGSMGWFGGVFMFLFWALVIAGIVLLVLRLAAGGKARGAYPVAGSESAVDILKKRYAAGEISKEEFDRMKRDVG